KKDNRFANRITLHHHIIHRRPPSKSEDHDRFSLLPLCHAFLHPIALHPEATGLENIYLRGLQMGLRLKEIRALIPTVLDFSELKDDIEKPLATYSTGMRLRLAVAVSTMIEPDILLLDEWIGAGDAAFNAKVKERMMSLVEGSRGLVLATHNTGLMKSLCTHGMVLEKGRSIFIGPVDDALAFYREKVAKAQQSQPPRSGKA
ncbi:MAG: hypothetical protein ABJN75_11005, partial [Hoeflea sp.]